MLGPGRGRNSQGTEVREVGSGMASRFLTRQLKLPFTQIEKTRWGTGLREKSGLAWDLLNLRCQLRIHVETVNGHQVWNSVKVGWK